MAGMMDLQENDLFGPLLQDLQKQETPPAGHQAGKRAAEAQAVGQRSTANPRGSGRPSEWDQDLMEQIARLVLWQEDAMNRIQQNTMTIMQFRNNPQAPDAVIPILAQEWKARFQQQNSKTVCIPMRQSLFLGVFKELLARLQKFQNTPAAQEAAKTRGWVTSEGHWNSVTWNPELQKHEVRDGPTTSQETMIQQVQECIAWAKEQHVLTRFSPTRPIAAEMTNKR